MKLGLSVFNENGEFTYVSHTCVGGESPDDWVGRSVWYGMGEDSWLWEGWGKVLTKQRPVKGVTSIEDTTHGSLRWVCSLHALPEVRNRVACVWHPPTAGAEPTEQELRCLTFLARGNALDAASDVLGISKTTVKTVMRNVRAKLNAKTNTQAVGLAVEHGWISCLD